MREGPKGQSLKVVIAGGGTAGWVTAAVLSAQIGGLLDITLVESDSVGTVGVGEATIPTHKTFHNLIGVEEAEFMRETKATFKLAIAFEDWGALGDRYVHPFGSYGKNTWMTDFHSLWRQAKDQGFGGEFDDYCLELQAAESGKFGHSEKQSLNHAYHLDSGLYAKYLRKKSEARGVKRLEGFIDEVRLDTDSGDIEALKLDDGRVIEGDLFIDCTGFRALLIGKALGVKHIDFGKWLRVDRAIAVQTEPEGEILPYTRCMARGAGWQWRIPLQHRVGNGHVYASDYMDDDEALSIFTDSLSTPTCSEPNFIKFKTGRLERIWEKNCIAIGLSSGFLEPLESTSIHLIQIIATRLIKMFPFHKSSKAVAGHFNKEFVDEFDSIRDFIILHYNATQRDDTAFWRDMQSLDIPDSLASRLELYKESGIVYQHGLDLFRADSWHAVLRGQGMVSDSYHHVGKMMPPEQLQTALGNLRSHIDRNVKSLPLHGAFLKTYCMD
jgi:tryptophan 7-halogenase